MIAEKDSGASAYASRLLKLQPDERMIRDPEVHVACDARGCWHELIVAATTRDEAEARLPDLGWIVDGGRHFCSAHCARTAGERGGER